jgi:hypothetical protein
MTLYPKIRNVKKDNMAIRVMIILSIIVSIICLITNICTSTGFLWSFIVIIGIIYSWITVMYSIHRNVNIASNVMVQLIIISALLLAIDYIIGYSGWSVNLAIPIIIMVANITMFVLTLSSFHKYKYAIYQLIIFLISEIPLGILLLSDRIITNPIFTIISSSIALFTFIFSLILCGKNIIEELDRRLHM